MNYSGKIKLLTYNPIPSHYGLVLLIFLLFISFLSYAQSETEVEDIIANQILDEANYSDEISDFSEQLSDLLRNPIDLNKATEQEFKQLIFLSNYQIQQIILHRRKIERFISPLELQVVPGISLEQLEQLLPFVIVKDRFFEEGENFQSLVHKTKGSWMMTYNRGIEVPRGYEISDPEKSRYLGSPDKIANRFRWSYRDKVKLSFNLEKDAGEPFFKEKQKYGFDYYSASILFNNIGSLDKLIVGDYLLQFGQGLVLWNGPIFGNGASVAHIMQNGRGIRPHTGMMENKFMRGVAVTFKTKNLELTPFFSHNQLTATIKSEDDQKLATSINYSGLHRTPSELRNRNSLNQMAYGFNLNYFKTNLKIGTNISSTHFNIPLKLNNRTYSQYRFEGENLQNVSIYYQYNFLNLLIFGESAHSINSGWANNHGLIAAMGRKFSTSISYRNYTPDYHSFFAQSFQEQSTLGNEKGWHLSLVYHPKRRFEWVNSIDYTEFPWMKFRTKIPSHSYQVRTQMSYIWYKKGHLRFRYQYKFYQENYPADLKEFEGVADVERQQARLIFLYKLTPNFHIANQVEGKLFHKTNLGASKGFLIFQDIIWNKPKWKMGGNLRFSYFNAADYETRIFTYERNVLHSFSFPSYFRQGFRFYINKKIKPFKGLDIWIRYGISKYLNVEELGSGLDKIAGNKKSDIRFQIRYSW